MKVPMADTPKRDLEVFSRQQLVLGKHGLDKLLGSSLCIVGVDGLGAEIAKNCLLAGITRLVLCDDHPITDIDISTNLCLRNKSFTVSSMRAEESALALQQFNPNARIVTTRNKFTLELYQANKVDLVVVCNNSWSEGQQIASVCRENKIPVMLAFTGGLYFLYAVDLGEYEYLDVKQNKQVDVKLSEIKKLATENTENEAGKEPRVLTYQAAFYFDALPLGGGDTVNLLDSNGQVHGTATILSIDSANSNLTFSTTTDITEDTFIVYQPQSKQYQYPPLSEQKGRQAIAQLVCGLQAWEKLQQSSETPRPRDNTFFEKFFSLCEVEENKEYYRQIYNTSFAPTVPVNSIVGGLVSEQIVKVMSRCFAPITEWKGNDFFELMYNPALTVDDCTPSDSDFERIYCSQILNFGKNYQYALAEKSVLVVGAGALGNEYVKGSALIGLSTRDPATFIVVDNDCVMTSNISRQLCFSEVDTLTPKATTLCKKVQTNFNAGIKLEPVILKLDHTTEGQIGHAKLDKIDVFVSALDNVAARNTLERISHMYNKPMIDGGTDGMYSTQQNFFPNKTAEYYSPHIPLQTVVSCTPKPVVRSRDDVVHNAKILFEKVVKHILDGDRAHDSFLDFIGEEIRTAWATGSTQNQTLNIAISPANQQDLPKSLVELTALKKEGKLSEFFDKDQVQHVRLLKLLCDIVAQTFHVPPPDVMEIRHKAGNIIPSIISATAIAAGFMLLNSLQIANAEPHFTNAACSQSRLILTEPRTYEAESQHIFKFGKISDSTTFADIINKVPSKLGEVHECIVYSDHEVTLPRASLSALANKSVVKFLIKNAALHARKHFVIEFKFQKVTEDMDFLQDRKFLVLTLPAIIRRQYTSKLVQLNLQETVVAQEVKISTKKRKIHEITSKNSSLVDAIRAKDAVIQNLSSDNQNIRQQLQSISGKAAELEATVLRERESARLTQAQQNANLTRIMETRDAIAAKELNVRTQLKNAQAQHEIDEANHVQVLKQLISQAQVAEREYTEAYVQVDTIKGQLEAGDRAMDEEIAKSHQYETEIQTLQQAIADQMAKLGDVEKRLKDANDNWLPNWMHNFYNSFKRVSCTSRPDKGIASQTSNEDEDSLRNSRAFEVAARPQLKLLRRPAEVFGFLKDIKLTTIEPKPKPSELFMEPLVLPNQGNTCYLASMTQLLYVAYTTNRELFRDSTSEVGKRLETLFATKNTAHWSSFVNAFFQFKDFIRGQEDDSGKAFEAVASAEWPNPDPNIHPHVVSKTFYAEPINMCTEALQQTHSENNFIIYAGNSSAEADIAQNIAKMHNRVKNCGKGCGKRKERTDFEHWPSVLFMKTSNDASFLIAAKRGIIFPRVMGGQEVEKVRYELIGVSIHSGGSVASGHYTALVLLGGRWWSCSDSYKQQVSNIEKYADENSIIKLLVFKQC